MLDLEGQRFSYLPLEGLTSFRLFRLKHVGPKATLSCILEVHDLLQCPEYVALSYCWGVASSTQEILVNDLVFDITTNLASVLRQLQSEDGNEQVYFWADAICINQADDLEKDVQIRLMTRIFSTAYNVLACLSRGDSDMDRLSTVKRYVDSGLTLPEDTATAKRVYQVLVRCFMALSQLDYWTRIWVVQEVSLARHVEIVCGSIKLAWSDFFAALYDTIRDDGTDQMGVRKNLSSFVESCSLRLQSLDSMRRRMKGKEKLPLLQAMYWTRDCGASQSKDKFFALLGMATDDWRPELTPFYPDLLGEVELKITLHSLIRPAPPSRGGGPSYLLDTLTFANVDYQIRGGRIPRWSQPWAHPNMWNRLRAWQHLCLDWHDPPFRATEPLTEMPIQTESGALRARGYCLGLIYDFLNGLGRVYRDYDGMKRAMRDVHSELEAMPRKGILEWPVKNWDEETIRPGLKTDLFAHRFYLSLMSSRVGSVTYSSGSHPTTFLEYKFGSTTDSTDAKPADEEEEKIDLYERYVKEVRDFMLLGSSLEASAANSTWDYEYMRPRSTKRGFIGFFPRNCSGNDSLWLVEGCSTPMVLRRFGSGLSSQGHIVVGEALVFGLMRGEFFRRERGLGSFEDSVLKEGVRAGNDGYEAEDIEIF